MILQQISWAVVNISAAIPEGQVALPFLMHLRDISTSGVKIAVGHQIFPTDLIKLLISYVDKFSKMSDSKQKKPLKKDKKGLKKSLK